jgi:hypothetical protein
VALSYTKLSVALIMIHDNLAVSASIVDIKGRKEEFSVLVSLSKLLLFLVAD